MAQNYTRSITSDFTAAADCPTGTFAAELFAAGITSAELLSVTLDDNGDDVHVLFSAALSTSSPDDLATFDASVAAHTGVAMEFKENFEEKKYGAARRLEEVTWYAKDNAGTLEFPVRKIVYSYTGNDLMSETTSTYDLSGNVDETTVTNLYTDVQAPNTYVRKKE